MPRSAAALPAPLLVIAIAAVAAVGCSADDVATPTYEFSLFPKIAHSGFNPTASFEVMFATGARGGVEWAIADPAIATIAASAPPKVMGKDVSDLQFAIVTTMKAGETTVSVKGDGKTLTAQLIVKAYTDEHVATGKARYEAASTDPARAPCAQCHAKPEGVDHSPLKMAGFDDTVILGVIQAATYPGAPTGQSTLSAFAPTGPLKFAEHKWNLTDPEKDGILAHLRSLPLGGLK